MKQANLSYMKKKKTKQKNQTTEFIDVYEERIFSKAKITWFQFKGFWKDLNVLVKTPLMRYFGWAHFTT